ncbi:MAG: phosphonate ABC transporter, permease protein PhnE [Anaerolineae bacterium]|nr:phosphonate ABC transporter, permease protein PhnE [Anaerolineae bacterium]
MDKRVLALLVGAAVFLWAVRAPATQLPRVVAGVPFVLDYLRGMWPPDFGILPRLAVPLRETVQMAVTGICLSSAIAVPLSFLAARETSPAGAAYAAARGLIGFARAVPTLLWAILFVSMVGLGPLAGVFAITMHCIGSLGKHFSESIEAMHPRVVDVLEAMCVDGATSTQALFYGLVPALTPLFLGYIIYYFEWALRTSTILGLVGAGGLGLQLTTTIRLFKRRETAAVVLLILGMVALADLGSRVIRHRVLKQTV